jgi:hypothetical protein
MGLTDYFMIIFGLASMGLLIHEVAAYKQRSSDPALSQFAKSRLKRRSAGVVLILVAVGTMLAGDFIQRSTGSRIIPLLLWGVCLVCAIGIFVVVIADVKETAREILIIQEDIIRSSFGKEDTDEGDDSTDSE